MAIDPQIQQLSSELASLTRALRDMIASTSRTTAAQIANQAAMLDAEDQLEAFRQSLRLSTKDSKEEARLKKLALDAKKKEMKLNERYQQSLKLARKQADRHGQGSARHAAALQTSERYARRLAAAQSESALAVEAASRATRGFSKGVDVASASAVWFGSTLKTQSRQIAAQFKASGGVMEGSSSLLANVYNQQMDGLKHGLTGEQFVNLQNSVRQTANAMGGAAKMFDVADASIDRFRIVTMNSEEAAKLALAAMEHLAVAGIKPTAAALDKYADDVLKLRASTGMQIGAAQAFYQDIAASSESIDLLRKSRAGEREAILANQRALVNTNIALGMTAEQAKEASKTLNKMAGAKPIDRLKQAAKIRAIGGAMGISGSEEAARDLIAGKKNSEAVMNFMKQAATARDSATGEGNLASEIFVTSLLDKLDMSQYLGANSPFSTSLNESLRSNAVLIDVTQTGQGQVLGKLQELLDKVTIIATGQNIWGVALAGAAAILTFPALLRGLGRTLAWVADKLGKGARGAAAGAGAAAGGAAAGGATGGAAEGAAAGAGQGASKTLGAVAKGLKILGPLAAGLLSTYEGAEHYSETGRKGESIGIGAGGFLGSMGAGAAAGAGAGALGGAIAGPPGMAIGGLLGGVGGGIYGGVKGSQWGKELGGWYDDTFGQKAKPPLPPANMSSGKISPAQKADDSGMSTKGDETSKTLDDILTANNTIARLAATQTTKQDQSVTNLKAIIDALQKNTDVAEKMLVAMTMTEKERTSLQAAHTLRKDNKFGQAYGYV